MAIAFAGTAPFGASILRGLIDGVGDHASREVALVISQPDRPAGRGRKVSSPAVAQLARERGLRLVQPERTHSDDMLALYAELGIDTIIVAAFGQMIREPLLTDYLMLNVHGSLLPEYRGAAPVERVIMDGRAETGVGIMRMEAGLDTGPVAYEGTVPIGQGDDAGTVFAALAETGGALLHRALDDAEAGTLTFTAQDDSCTTYAHKITADDRRLDCTQTAQQVHDRVRALSPHIGAFVMLGDERLGVWKTTPITSAAQPEGASPTSAEALAATVHAQPGRVAHSAEALVIGTGDGAVVVLELQPSGKRRMLAGDWLRGLRTPLSTDVVAAPASTGASTDA